MYIFIYIYNQITESSSVDNLLILQIRMQAQYRAGAPKQSLIRSFVVVYREEGFRGLYRVSNSN